MSDVDAIVDVVVVGNSLEIESQPIQNKYVVMFVDGLENNGGLPSEPLDDGWNLTRSTLLVLLVVQNLETESFVSLFRTLPHLVRY